MLHEIKLLVNIGLPTSLVQLFVYFVFTQAASSVGLLLGTVDLASFSLASLTGNLFCLSIIIGGLSASDTLMPRAFGLEHYKEVGLLAIRGFLACSLVLSPFVIIICFSMEPVFVSLGQDPEVSKLASEWLKIYILGVPFVLLFRDLQRFLASQNIVFPMVVGSFVGGIVAAPLIIGKSVKLMGFKGSIVAIVIIQIVTVVVSLLYLWIKRPHHPQTWPGFSALWTDSIKIGPLLSYLHLSTGGVISFTEWWFWETMCFTAGKFGVIPFCVHSIAYQLLPLVYMVPLGISMGLTVRMGALFPKSVKKVKLLVGIVLLFNALLAGSIAFCIYIWRDDIIRLFTGDEIVIQGCHDIWGKISIYVFFLYFYCVNSYITRAFGQQWRLAGIVVLTLWIATLPTVIYVCVYRGGGLDAMWTILPIAYCTLNIILVANYVCFTDWEEVGKQVRLRKLLILNTETENGVVSENTRLIRNGSPIQS